MLTHALKLCPALTTIPYDFELYRIVADQVGYLYTKTNNCLSLACNQAQYSYTQVYRILFSCDAIVQPVSVDEAYIEYMNEIDPISEAQNIRQKIFDTTGCAASIGIGGNMLVARLATKKVKAQCERNVCTSIQLT